MMRRTFWVSGTLLLLRPGVEAQTKSLTWEQVRERFETSNPTLLAGKLNVDESKAQEITAFLRPNPTFTVSADGTQIVPHKGVWQPLAGTFDTPATRSLNA